MKRYAAPINSTTAHLLDNLTYNYESSKKNKLKQVGDAATNTAGYSADLDLPNQSNSSNYVYNSIGELVENKQEGRGYEYNAAGLVTRVFELSTNNSLTEYTYNDKGLKYSKTSYSGGLFSVETEQLFYVYDAGGAEVATYKKLVQVPNDVYALQYHTLYGAGRVGLLDKGTGKALFELSDHLGNIRAVVTASANGAAETVSYTDYYSHGGTMPGRTYQSSLNFPYGYQGQEKDGATGLTNFELRQYDPRIGRWYNPDPYGQHHSPYLAMSNNPVSFTDSDGGWDGDDPGNPEKTKGPVQGYSYGDQAMGNGIYDRYDTGWGHGSDFSDSWIDRMEYQVNRGADIHRRNELRGKYTGIGAWYKEVSINGISEGKTFDGFYGGLRNGTKETISASDAILYASQVSSSGTQPYPAGRPFSDPIPGAGNSSNPTSKPPFRFVPPIGGLALYSAFFMVTMQGDSRESVSRMNWQDKEDFRNNGYIVLFRGVSEEVIPNMLYPLAQKGIAIPKGYINGGPHKNPDDHTMSDNYSIWTSWSSDPQKGKIHARGPMGRSAGVILVKAFKISTLVRSNLGKTLFANEDEYLVPGVVTGASVINIKAK